MPNIFSIEDQFVQNGHYPTNQNSFSEEPVQENVTNSQSLTPNRLNSSEYRGDDWSSLTQELINTLPRVWTRGLLYLLITFSAIVVPWSVLAKVDETGNARGRLEPKGATLRLDAPVAGTVTKVNVKEGEKVQSKQVLLELESDLLRSELQQVQTKLEGQLNRLTQLELIKNQLAIAINTQQQQNQAQILEKQAQVEQAKENLNASQTNYNLQQEKLAQVEQARRSLSDSKKAYTLADSRLAKDEAEIERYRQFVQMGIIARIQIVEKERLVDETRKIRLQSLAEVRQAESRLQEQQGSYQKMIHQALAEIRQAESRLKEQQSSYQSLIQSGKLAVLKSEEQLRDFTGQIATLKSEIAASESQIQSFKFQLNQRLIRAPIEGTIFQFPIQRAGTVVQPGQAIAQIAPKGAVLVFKAQMPISESGFLRQGMPVKIKFDAYPFQDYGVVEGHLSWISPDSKQVTTGQTQQEMFELEITLEKPFLQSANKNITLTPGQTATAEVVIRQRRIIDFLIDPFKKLQKGGLEL